MMPAFSACTESPEPGISTSRTVSATPITSTSLCPAPTVSRKITSFPPASSTSIDCNVDSAIPPRCPRVPIDRMKTPGIEEVIGEPDPVTEQRSVRERARRVDRDHPDGQLLLADVANERADQGRLADAGRPGHADRVRPPRLRVDVPDDLVRERVGVLDEGDRARQRTRVAGADARGEGFARPLPPLRHGREGYSWSAPSSAGSGAAAETIGNGSTSTWSSSAGIPRARAYDATAATPAMIAATPQAQRAP